MTEKLVIRRPTPDQLPAAEALEKIAFAGLRQVYIPKNIATSTTVAERLEVLRNDQIVATVRYQIDGDRWHLQGLAVEESHRRSGVARALIEYLANEGQTNGVSSLSLFTVRQTGNVQVFERLGFDVVREGPAFWAESPTGESLTEVFMERVL